ncbi:hypothetical protein MP228_010498 [Amoeboaphelidium protococcarum]|nr:hypothetical protein MP228_010498 [Amoeboaphelidium protococcarum]
MTPSEENQQVPVVVSGQQKKMPEYMQYLSLYPFGDTGDDSIQEYTQSQSINQFPSGWSTKDKCAILDLSRQQLRVTYSGPGKSDSDAASVRANTYARPYHSIHYYETTIVDKGRDGYIGIGYQLQNVSLARLPGWELQSWGYHGDDGNSFGCSGTGVPFGPTFTTGDVIGCGVNFHSGDIFYTKNGSLIGVAFRDFYRQLNLQSSSGSSARTSSVTITRQNLQLYPCVGLRTVGEIVESNFGQKPFRFDIIQYIKEEKAKLYQQVIHSSYDVLEDDLGLIVLNYLLYEGMLESARSLASSFPQLSQADLQRRLQDCEQRRDICSLISKGDIDNAISLIDRIYPCAFDDEELAYVHLKCRKFIEMIIQVNYPQNADHQMQIDGDHDGSIMSTDSSQSGDVILAQALQYGQSLQEEFRDDDSPLIQSVLTDTFSILAYPDPMQSPVRSLLDLSGRQALAEETNRVLYRDFMGERCKLSGKDRRQVMGSSLQLSVDHVVQCLKELQSKNDGVCGLVDLSSYIRNSEGSQ